MPPLKHNHAWGAKPSERCPVCDLDRTGPYRLIDGTWSDEVDRLYRLKSSGFAMDNKRIHVYKGPWDFWTGCEWRAWSPLAGSKFFPTHAEAIAYADRMARTNQGDNNG